MPLYSAFVLSLVFFSNINISFVKSLGWFWSESQSIHNVLAVLLLLAFQHFHPFLSLVRQDSSDDLCLNTTRRLLTSHHPFWFMQLLSLFLRLLLSISLFLRFWRNFLKSTRISKRRVTVLITVCWFNSIVLNAE